ncbi:glucosylceramidase-like [Trichoplusia ni]|uniref:Glucosylceramidase n=1 Tax=Trichoplusia ni TaxID=7111 RepID=A0A7E5X433_TRINI|nr:glucosylceramidase-like [Trichoplusia ni]XP_026747405.1 glucosylceramidase-like [Trichoplusia ni]XP_026747406.1 glucosylceramidase-like [Trichoplusia ni]
MAISKAVGFIATILLLYSLNALGQEDEDLPCNRRDVGIEGRSVVCVCTATYCDTITRRDPEPGTYVVYTSSNAGQRFEKSSGRILEEVNNGGTEDDAPAAGDGAQDPPEASQIWNNVVLRIRTISRHQYIEGFGGSVTDAAAINWRKLSDATQQQFIDSYFGPKGLEYNLIRVPIGGCDFSEHPYTYAETPWHDTTLSNFSLSSEDYFLKLPMIRRSQRVATDEIKITASTWSPPIWMKTNEAITGFGQLRPQYYQAYADYHLRFIEEYDKIDVKIWAITTTNEPINGIVPFVQFNSLGWAPSQLGRWVANNLGPTIRNSPYNKTLILGVDDQRYLLPIYLAGMEREDPKSIDYLDGIAVHWYGNFFPPQTLSLIQNRYPDKIILATEACEGSMPWHLEQLAIGSWERARRYVTSIIDDLNNFVVGWIDWNLCLSPTGGPNWADNFVDAPILVYGDKDEFIKQPMFYAMGHFSKFIPRGARRVTVSRASLATVENVAFIKENGNIVVVLQNRLRRVMNVKLRISNRNYIDIVMEERSVKTIEINPSTPA